MWAHIGIPSSLAFLDIVSSRSALISRMVFTMMMLVICSGEFVLLFVG
jgi:hypothetical protein